MKGLWIGRDAGRVETHAHHAIQIALAMDSGFLMRHDVTGWREDHGAIVMPASLTSDFVPREHPLV
jgi:hypothetical protein